jgi:phage terminase large subunit GpA-like protein
MTTTPQPSGEEDDTLPVFHKSPLMAVQWAVKCPCCSHEYYLDATEQDDGAFNSEEPFVQCEACDEHIEVQSVQIQVVS